MKIKPVLGLDFFVKDSKKEDSIIKEVSS